MKLINCTFKILSSFELLFVLLILLALSMAIGTVLPQQDDPENYIRFWGSEKTKTEIPAEAMQSAAMQPAEKPSPEIDRAKGERVFKFFRKLGFLNLYHSTWFLVLCYLLMLNVFLCFVKRWSKASLFLGIVQSIPARAWEVKTFPIPIDWEEEKPIKLVEAYLLLSNRLRKSGFALKGGKTALDAVNPTTNGKSGSQLEQLTMVAAKGITAKPISMIFHVSLVISLLACGLGSLYAFETKVLVEKGVKVDDWLNRGEFASKTLAGELVGMAPSLLMSEPRVLPLADSKKENVPPSNALDRLRQMDKSFTDKVTSAHKSMVANPFTIDHFDRLISYPGFYAVNLVDFTTDYVSYKKKPSPKRWFPKVQFLDSKGSVLYEKVASSNYPAKFKGIMYYISDYSYKFQVIVEAPDGSIAVLPSTPPDGKGFAGFQSRMAYGFETRTFRIDPLPGEFKVKNIYYGRLFPTEKAADFEMIEPYVDVQYAEPGTESSKPGMPSMNDGGMPSKMPEYVKLTTAEGYRKLDQEPLTIGGYKLYLGEINPVVEFGVRHDPGIPWFYFFGYLACLAMALRIYYPSYRVRITIETKGEDLIHLSYNLQGWGLFSNTPEIRKNITLPKDIN